MLSSEYVKQAVAEDRAENYEKAFELYMTALEFFKTHLKYEKNPKSKEAIMAKVRNHLLCQAGDHQMISIVVTCSSRNICNEQRT